jgi:acetyl-CoA carboxylase, biotin carboxylase subunit
VLEKVLVANRGEVAVRVIRALRALGVASVAVYSEPDAGAPHARLADEAHPIGPGPAAESYLDGRAMVDLALRTGCDAVHPGYGFLSENAAFAERCAAAGLAFVGPGPDAIEAMGSKTRARELVAGLGIPVVPGSAGAVGSARYAREAADEIGYPVAVKAAGGGGGMGFRVAADGDELEAALDAVRDEGARLFGEPAVYLERYFEDPRHVEVQVLADGGGGIVHLGERDCTVQRRHQKLVEESPAPALARETRAGLCKTALAVANAVNYVSAGTVEFLVDRHGGFYFLEMNTRIQVEHPVTEMVTGIDLVREQIRIASGEGLGYKQDAIRFTGHAIECRVNAEDPEHFVPSSGRVTQWVPPGGPNVRVDSHLMSGYVVPPHYDSLIAKVIVHGRDRAEAIARMHRALSETVITGPKTTIPFHLKLLTDPVFLAGEFTQPKIEHSL